jgi:RND family efflux transporter MFP subunit
MKLTIFALPALLMLAACGHAPEAPAGKTAPPAIRTTVEKVGSTKWSEVYSASGSVEAVTRTVLSAQVTGTVSRIPLQVGDTVAAGQVLVTLNANQYAIAQTQGDASEREANAALPELDSAIESAQAQLQLATLNEGRMRDLLEKRSVTKQELDEAESRLRQATAALSMAQARRKQADFRVTQAEQVAKSARVFVGYTTITAPFAGVVVEKHAEAGSLAAPGIPLLTLERAGAYRVAASVPESQGGQLRVGQPLTVVWEGEPEATSVRISEILPSVDPSTRMLTIKANLPARPRLRSGMFVRVEWPLPAGEPALTIPASAIRTQGQLQMVLVVENRVARLRMVTLGDRREKRYRVLSGLNEGEVIVTAPSSTVVDGVGIEVQQ